MLTIPTASGKSLVAHLTIAHRLKNDLEMQKALYVVPLKALATEKYNELLNIDGIGETQVNSVKNFFSNKVNLDVLNQLAEILDIKDVTEDNKNGKLKNKTFMITGKLNGISRAEVKSLIEENAGAVVSSVSKKLNYLIVGEKPTKRKMEAAKNLKIITLDQKQFLTLLNKTS